MDHITCRYWICMPSCDLIRLYKISIHLSLPILRVPAPQKTQDQQRHAQSNNIIPIPIQNDV